MSSDPALREAVAARLVQHEACGLGRLNVELDREQVTLWTRAGRLHATCTCGGADECAHFWAALALFVDGPTAGPQAESRARVPSWPPLSSAGALEPLADAFDELSLAIARAGLSHADSPSIKQAIDQVVAAAPDPAPLPLARWIGRLHGALAVGDVATCARLLHGALAWADQLRGGDVEAPAWLGAGTPAALADVSLLEVAREWLAGLDRASIERRYLIDLASGALYAEERRRGAIDCSVGPCPRSAHVAFAELDAGALPARVRLLQYTLSLQLPESVFARVVELAAPEVAALRTRFLDELARSPAHAEPFALLAPAYLEDGPAGALRDARGERLALGDEHGGIQANALRAAIRGAELACVLGRLIAGAAGLTLHPLSAIVRRGGFYELRRVT